MTIDVRRRWDHVPSRFWGGVPHIWGTPAWGGIGWTAVMRGLHGGRQVLLGSPTTVPRWWNRWVWWTMGGGQACPSCSPSSPSTPSPCSASVGTYSGTRGIEVRAIRTSTSKTILAVASVGLPSVVVGFAGPGWLQGWQIMQNNNEQWNAGSLPCYGDPRTWVLTHIFTVFSDDHNWSGVHNFMQDKILLMDYSLPIKDGILTTEKKNSYIQQFQSSMLQ